MKQSFEVFEQSDGVALHLTVTVDSDALKRGEARHTVEKLAYSTTATGGKMRESCRQHLGSLVHTITAHIERDTTAYVVAGIKEAEQNGHRARQEEVNDLNSKIAELNKEVEAERNAKSLLSIELADAKKAAKKPRATRKATRK